MECAKEYTKFVKNCVEPHPIQMIERLCQLEKDDPKCVMGDLSLTSHNFQRVMTVELTKQRVLQNYMFIGIMEHMEFSMGVLEKILPRFFDNSVEVLSTVNQNDFKNRTSANKKVQINELDNDIRISIEGAFRHEIDLYQFIEKILFDKVKELGIEGETVATEFLTTKDKVVL